MRFIDAQENEVVANARRICRATGSVPVLSGSWLQQAEEKSDDDPT